MDERHSASEESERQKKCRKLADPLPNFRLFIYLIDHGA